MDPVSQGIVGAVAAQTVADKINIKAATVMGLLGGMAADLDIFIRSADDPMFGLIMHRHFTHGIGFIPIAAVLAWFLSPLFKKWLTRKQVVLFFTVGYATHGLLDSFTSYGTYFLWPFSNARIAFSSVPIIDFFLTVPLITFVVLRLFLKRKRALTFAAVIWYFLYVSVGFFQNHRATQELKSHYSNYERVEVYPTIGNLTLWRGVIQTEDKIKTCAIKVPFFVNASKIDGGEVKRFMVNPFSADTTAGKDVEKFRHFCDGFVGLNSQNGELMDMRYAMLPQSAKSLWGIKLPKDSNEHVDFVKYSRGDKKTFKEFLRLLFGTHSTASPE
jgi:inner membrane protein